MYYFQIYFINSHQMCYDWQQGSITSTRRMLACKTVLKHKYISIFIGTVQPGHAKYITIFNPASLQHINWITKNYFHSLSMWPMDVDCEFALFILTKPVISLPPQKQRPMTTVAEFQAVWMTWKYTDWGGGLTLGSNIYLFNEAYEIFFL